MIKESHLCRQCVVAGFSGAAEECRGWVFRSFSEGIVPYVAVDLVCPWEEVSSGSSYAALLDLLVVFIFEIIVTIVYPQDIFPHPGLQKQ